MKNLLTATALTAALLCGATAAQAQAPKQPLRIGMSFQELNNPYFVTMKQALEEAAATIGATVVTTDARHDVAKQIGDVEDMIQKKVDILLLNPTDSTGVQSAVRSAKKAGLVVVAVDANAQGPVDSFVGSKNTDAGRLACEYLAKSIGEKGDVAILDGIPVVPILERVKGCREALAKYPGIKVVSTQNGKQERATALTVTENILQANKQPEGHLQRERRRLDGCARGHRRQRQGREAHQRGRRARSHQGDAEARLEIHRHHRAVPARPDPPGHRHRARQEVGRQRAAGGAGRREADRRRGREDLQLVTEGRS
jgi:hypothetical protein